VALTRRSQQQLHDLRGEIGELADDAARQVEDTWSAAWDQVSPSWAAAATAAVAAAGIAGRWPSAWQMARLPQVASAALRTREAATQAAAVSAGHVTRAAQDAITVTLTAEPEILAAQVKRAAAADFARGVSQAHAEQLQRQARQRVTAVTKPVGPDVAAGVEQALVRAPADVTAERVAARIQVVFQQGPQRAIATAQTETLDAYRAASAYVHGVNAAQVTGWMWISSLDRSSCPACWSMHGTLHPLREWGPAGHVGCRCGRAAIVRDPGGSITPPDGLALFRRMSGADQLRVLGPTRLQLLDDGDIDWLQLAVRRDNDDWRPSYVPRTVADLQRLAGVRT